MSSPFPGMDPYLEHPDFWQEFHSRLIVAIADALGPQLRPRYRVAIEKRVYEDATGDVLIGRPDAAVFRARSEAPQPKPIRVIAVAEPVKVEVPMPIEIYDRYLEIRDVSNGEVVTTVELISPTNKRPGRGRRQYETKRLKILGSQTHLVEIDLLRALPPLPMRGHTLTDYRILVSRAEQRPSADLYAFNLSEPIPPFPLPLKQTDTEPVVNLQTLLNQVYDRASYDLAIDYTQNPELPITSTDLDWLNHHLTEKGLRVK
ncbi:MAG: DUF4058 family protein [Cyanobacteria bacterium P01_F01_bin.4]